MSVWTHFIGAIEIQSFTETQDRAEQEATEKRLIDLIKTKAPFGTEGGLRVNVITNKDLMLVGITGDLRDVGVNTDMSASGLTSRYSDIVPWFSHVIQEIMHFGLMKKCIAYYYSDNAINPRPARVIYTVNNPDYTKPPIVIEQAIPHPRALQVD